MRARGAATAAGALALVLAVAGCAGTGSDRAVRPPVAKRPNAQDSSWITTTHQANVAEITAGRLARRRGASKAVRTIGGTLVADHSQADTELRRTASKLRMSMPLRPTAEQRAIGDRVSHESGAAFDRDFIKTQTAAHKTAIAHTTTEYRRGQDIDVRGLAHKSLPVLQKHLWMLQHIRS